MRNVLMRLSGAAALIPSGDVVSTLIVPGAVRNTSDRLALVLTALVLALFLVRSIAVGEEIIVAQDGAGDFSSIQDAIDVAREGDVITVFPGGYRGWVTFLGNNITLRSIDPSNPKVVAETIIEGDGDGSTVMFDRTENETCLMAGFTITGGIADIGGGINGGNGTGHSSRASLEDCVVTGNSAEYGAGVYDFDGPIIRCEIVGNTARQEGGGLHFCDGPISDCVISRNKGCNGAGISRSNGDITGCVISDNLGEPIRGYVNDGAGLSVCGGKIAYCTIAGNSGAFDGGGLACCDGEIVACEISGNEATYGGGLDGCDGLIRGCLIEDNAASAYGGGLYWCNGQLEDSLVIGNSADWGGGLYLYGCNIANCLIAGNEARSGAALGIYSGKISSCTIADNEPREYNRSLSFQEVEMINSIVINRKSTAERCWTSASFSCIQDWQGGEGNVSDDPLFVNGPLGDYYLSCKAAGQKNESPCINAGSGNPQQYGLEELTTRSDGAADVGVIDMGFHYPVYKPQVEASLNDFELTPGDSFQGFVEVANPGSGMDVSFYVGIITPWGEIFCLTEDGFVSGIHPILRYAFLPSGFHFGPAPILELEVPVSAPAGVYQLACALDINDPRFPQLIVSTTDFEIQR